MVGKKRNRREIRLSMSPETLARLFLELFKKFLMFTCIHFIYMCGKKINQVYIFKYTK